MVLKFPKTDWSHCVVTHEDRELSKGEKTLQSKNYLDYVNKCIPWCKTMALAGLCYFFIQTLSNASEFWSRLGLKIGPDMQKGDKIEF